MLSVHCGFKPSDINEFYYPDYLLCFKELQIKLNFDEVKGLMGNSNSDKDSFKCVSDSSPFRYSDEPKQSSQRMTRVMAEAMMGQKK